MANRAAETDFFLERLAAVPAFAVVRDGNPDAAARRAEACWDAGIDLVEVSLALDPELSSLRAVCERAAGLGRIAGAGTVCTADQVHAAVEAGAAFAVAPGLHQEAVRTARATGLPYLPGVSTPTETAGALALGYHTLKLFPALLLGPDWVRSLSKPFPGARFIAVGGITADNARDFLDAGAVGVGIGSGVAPGELDRLVAALRGAAPR